jgi:hypothetical protein
MASREVVRGMSLDRRATAVLEMLYPEAAVHRLLRPTGSDGREQFREDIASREPI